MDRHRPLASVFATLLVSFAVSACTSGASVAPTSGSTSGPGAPGPTQVAGTPAAIAMCTLVQAGDVQSRVPFTIPFQDAKSTDPMPQGCVYRWSGSGEYASVLLQLTDFASAADARAAHEAKIATARENLGLEAQPISGLGDVAAAFPGGNEVGVQVVVGSRVLDVNLTGQYPDVTSQQKVAAGTEIARLVLARLP